MNRLIKKAARAILTDRQVERVKAALGREETPLATSILKTSQSDNGRYPDFCFLASIDTGTFQSFRQNPVYNLVLEHVTEELGACYWDRIIQGQVFNNEECLRLFQENDLYGSPVCYEYEGVGRISPTTLRYIKVLQDLYQEFGSLDEMNICEIGVGYGGQCRIICSYFNVKSYTLIDLPQVLSLAKAYLSNYPMSAKLNFLTMNELPTDQNYDLFVSNYAYSELRMPIQDCYFSKTIKNSERGYITYNNINHFNSYTLDDYQKKIKNLRVVDEDPLTYKDNKILIWKNQRDHS